MFAIATYSVSCGLLPQLVTGQFEKDILEIGRPMRIAKLRRCLETGEHRT
jgi:hypothetical protein